ncbi:hypothetical protein [Paraflavitalea sp. CAU 1676]|uniref:hypothetical protein n=1 Tax=Paraflavitalea sp. CAU 1676 TaxID=3032598 RepID=UPI0023DA914E|nr:hypothetical protein [Paraflavitalea sp. CAU 1676]MDF2188096.1 hypothetical protein [Paraflavitalea sp. CAU 1676]
MKTLIIIISTFTISISSFAQQDSAASMIEDAVLSLQEQNTILYIDRGTTIYHQIGRRPSKGFITGYLDNTKVVLRLKKDEIKWLNREFKKETDLVWPAHMFANSVRTSSDSIEYYQQKLLPSENGKKYKRYFRFSRVVYFRDSSMAVFRLSEMLDASGGFDYLFFYQRNDDGWKRYMKAPMGAW